VKWRGDAHYVYACVPGLKSNKWWRPGIRYLGLDGTGLLQVYPHTYVVDRAPGTEWKREKGYRVEETLEARYFPRPYIGWTEKLSELHKEWAKGGSEAGSHLTPYKITMLGIKEYLESQHPRWVPMDEVIASCSHHYTGKNPGGSIAAAIRQFENWGDIKVINNKLHARAKQRSKDRRR